MHVFGLSSCLSVMLSLKRLRRTYRYLSSFYITVSRHCFTLSLSGLKMHLWNTPSEIFF